MIGFNCLKMMIVMETHIKNEPCEDQFETTKSVEVKSFDEMDVFKSMRIYFKELEIRPPQFSQKCSVGVKTWIILSEFIFASISSCAFLFFEAQTFDEYTFAFNLVLTMSSFAFVLTILIWKKEKLFEFMTSFDTLIQNSK